MRERTLPEQVLCGFFDALIPAGVITGSGDAATVGNRRDCSQWRFARPAGHERGTEGIRGGDPGQAQDD